ncbi:hypothetical protein O0S10_01440 [Methanocorpusculum sp. MG]|uniref:Uncharacterized protein n=1 Tax=Methanocorpusculum petauri TaxID=3002863 RepID=A0ABT4IDR8_9EURY|nr:hypothetical protein [Methanocorpusculum petauri]MCZ0859889.1 hypothetical protein [Methanocorpusculum petauri]
MRRNKIVLVLSCAVVFLLLFAVAPAAADAQTYNPLQDQARTALIDQISGTEMTSAQYIQTVWPEVYQKISPVEKAKLSAVDQVWEMESGTIVGGKTVALTSFRPERLVVMDAVENLEITEAEYMQIVWPELWADMSTETKAHLANLPNMHSAATKITLVSTSRSIYQNLFVNPRTDFSSDRMYLKFKLTSLASWTSTAYRPNYHYAETLIYNSASVKVGSTVAYADANVLQYANGENEIFSENMIAWPETGVYRAEAMAYASLPSYEQVMNTHTARYSYTRPST